MTSHPLLTLLSQRNDVYNIEVYVYHCTPGWMCAPQGDSGPCSHVDQGPHLLPLLHRNPRGVFLQTQTCNDIDLKKSFDTKTHSEVYFELVWWLIEFCQPARCCSLLLLVKDQACLLDMSLLSRI